MNNIPTEILIKIIDFIGETNQKNLLQYALVCKSWKPIAEYKLYKSVNLNSLSSLVKFTKAISTSNSELAPIVKSVYVDQSNDSLFQHSSRVSTLLETLPNLEHFQSRPHGYYTQISNASLNSKLLKLKSISQPHSMSEIDNYLTCIKLLKNRLQSVSVLGDGLNAFEFNQQLQLLPQMLKLQSVQIKNFSRRPIKDVEAVMNKCISTMRQVEFNLELAKSDVSIVRPTTCKSYPNIESLKLIIQNMESYETFLLYIFYKFPALEEFYLRMETRLTLTNPFAAQFFTFLSKVDSIDVDSFKVKLVEVCDNIGEYWKTTANLTEWKRLERVNIQYNIKATSFEFLEFQKKHDLESQTNIAVYNPLNECIRLNLIEQYGWLISHLDIKLPLIKLHLDVPDRKEDNGVGKMVLSILRYCEKLEKLSIMFAKIKCVPDEDEIFEKTTLKELTFLECEIGHGVVNTLFSGVKSIDHIKFIKCLHRPINYDQKTFFNIDFPNTDVGTLSIDEPRHPHNATVFVLLSISRMIEAREEWSFYTRESTNSATKYIYAFKSIDDEEYNGQHFIKNAHIQISCRSLDVVQVNCRGPALPIHLNQYKSQQ